MIVVAETFIKESGVLPSQNLQLQVTATGQAQRTLETWLEHRAGSTQNLQGASPAGWMSRGTSRWFSSKSVRSVWKCVVERHLWVPYSSLLLEAGEGAASRTSLATASCR